MRLLKKHRSKKLDIGKPNLFYCMDCGTKVRAVRVSKFSSRTGEELSAHWSYECDGCGGKFPPYPMGG